MKGIFYSAIVMMLLAPIILYIIFYLGVSETQLEEVYTKIKGDRIAGYATSIEQDLPRALEITSKVAIGTAISYIDMNGIPLDNADERIIEVMENGTIYGSEFELFESDSIKDWIAAIEEKGHLYGFETNISTLSLEIKPYDSFNVLLSALISVNITDNRDMEIYRIYNESIVVSIEGFEDPLYSLNTNGLLKRKFAQAGMMIDGVTELDTAISNGLYMNSADGPSFFDRLEGRLETSTKYSSMATNQIGVETIVYLPDLSAAGLPIKPEQISIDYIYFNSTNIGYPVNNTIHSWLRLGDEHADIYNVELIK